MQILARLRRDQDFLTPCDALVQSLRAKAGEALGTPANLVERVAAVHEAGLQVPTALLGQIPIRQASAYCKAGEHEAWVISLAGVCVCDALSSLPTTLFELLNNQ